MKSIFVVALLLMQGIGFASIVSPNLTAVFDSRKMTVKLKWQNNDPELTGFVLQRSGDNNKWMDIYRIESSEFSSNKIEKFTDQQPEPTKNYYRLKMISENNNVEYSAPIMVIMGQPNNSWIMFPVPVSSVLNLQYTGSDLIKGVISVFIQNSNGKILTRFRGSSLNRNLQIPVSNLGKGIYDVRILIGDEAVWNQRFIK